MSDTIVTPVSHAGVDARQCMFRVWLVISAVWIAFWLAIAGIVLVTVEVRYPFADELGPFSLIVLTPPLALLGLGVALRWIFETVKLRTGHLPRAGRRA